MTTFGAALTQIGATALPGTDFVFASMAPGSGIVHALGAEVAEQEIPEDVNVYLAGGTFSPAAISASGGRKAENVKQVLWLQFDADLQSYSGLDAEFLHSMEQDQLNRWVEAQQADLEEVFRSIGLPIHRLDYTGYGLCAYLYLEVSPATDVQMIREAHKAFIAAVNETAEVPLLDPSVSDSGSRITRLPGSWNVKNPERPREVRTLIYDAGQHVSFDALRFALKRAEARPQRRPLPSTKALPAAVAQEIVSALKPYWTKGQKHAVSLALSGMLAKSGVPEAQALAMVEQLSVADDLPEDRAKSVRDSYQRARSGLETKGFYGLRDMIPAPALRYIGERLDRFEQSSRGVWRFEAEGPKGRKAEESFIPTLQVVPPPEACYQGWVGDYVTMMTPLTEAPSQFHLAAGLTLIGASIGRRVATRYVGRNLYGNLFTMIVGMAGKSRKDTAIDFAFDLPKYQGRNAYREPAFKKITDVGSPQGLLQTLDKYPNVWVSITEYERLAENAHRSSTPIFPLMIGAWNTPDVLENITAGSAIEANFPYLSMIAAVQPDVLAKHMLPNDINNGIASRWLFVPGQGQGFIADPPDINEQAAHELYNELMYRIESYGTRDERRTARILMTPEARECWIEWSEMDNRRPVHTDGETSMQSRLAVHVRKLSLLYAVADGAKAIEVPHLNSAIAFVEWMWPNTRELMKSWGTPLFSIIENRIEQVLTKKGPVKRRILQGACKNPKWDTVDFNRVLEALMRSEVVVADAEGCLTWES